MYEGAIDKRGRKIKAAKKVRFKLKCCGLSGRETMQCATPYLLGGRPSRLEYVRARIYTELKCVSKPEEALL
jgi:hypothetical protein